ncbi:DUF488 domain-containing protein [Pelagibacterium lacus]|uniref:DUF488 domain-containing protein n=1 Tax=Pelagibacterium lacus TaxID=2282655 RepID=A0A369W9V8_9HYPH|nr:DUF488 domain-containing protein [Pelagibacterium lacus]RDE10052.1 DUF488 domain-containing protein [Pelagibacterium lacus]
MTGNSPAIKRAYEPADKEDGYRVLVDRLWPRGLHKDDAALDEWLKDVAPSTELRKWFNHDPERFPEFRRRYRKELSDNPDVEKLAALAKKGKLTLVYSARDETHNQARVLAEYLAERQRSHK